MSFNEYYLLDPRELGEPRYGAEGFDVDLHGPKYKSITPEMREQERMDERRRNRQFLDDEFVRDVQNRLLDLIPKENLQIPLKWFDSDADAEKFFIAVARSSDISVHFLRKSNMGKNLCRFLDVVLEHRGLRLKKENDPPHMSLQQRRDRHWQAVIENSSLAKHFSLRLVRHAALMFVGASLAFARSKRIRTPSTELFGKIDRLSEWFLENDPNDVESFEHFHPDSERMMVPKSSGQAEHKSSRRWGRNCRKRKAQERLHRCSNAQQKRPVEPRSDGPRSIDPQPPLSAPRPNVQIELPERLAKTSQIELPERLAKTSGGNRC